ncbi:hypothetical protein [Vibrio coralliilyticus]|uniref:hypothetical protein n=1 Tax=Vibrio coralliilyticus TaxID=190893 RepID=UPI0002DB5165|nr:hypothetical protein [Vibrio coralliilyticus]
MEQPNWTNTVFKLISKLLRNLLNQKSEDKGNLDGLIHFLQQQSESVESISPLETYQELFNCLKSLEMSKTSFKHIMDTYDEIGLTLENNGIIHAHLQEEQPSNKKRVYSRNYEIHRSKDHINGLIKQLETRQSELNKRVKKGLDDIEESAWSNSSEIKRQLTKQGNSAETELKNLTSASIQRIETLVSDSSIRLSEEAGILNRTIGEETTRSLNNTIDKKVQEVTKSLDDYKQSTIEWVESKAEKLSTDIQNEVNEFCSLNEALRKTLSFIASDALADSSIKQAQQEKETADSLRKWGVLWLVVSIALFVITFDYDKLLDDQGLPQYTLILLRSFFLIIGITPGFYLLRESARHRTDERQYRQKGIQLATIDSYFAEFENNERNEVKKGLSKHYFHGPEHFVDSSSVDKVQSRYDKVFDKLTTSKKLK